MQTLSFLPSLAVGFVATLLCVGAPDVRSQQSPTSVYCYCGQGNAGDVDGQRWIFGQLGLIDANGRLYDVMGDYVKQSDGTVVGRVIRNGQGDIIGYRNAAGTREAYDLSTTATTSHAWMQVATGGDFYIVKHGSPNGGSLLLDLGKEYSGFRDSTVPTGPGTRSGSGNPYPLPPRAGANIHMHLCVCYAAKDPDGAGPGNPQRSVTESAMDVPGVGMATGPMGKSKGRLVIDLIGGSAACQNDVFDCLTDFAARHEFTKRIRGVDGGHPGAWIASYSLRLQYQILAAHTILCLRKLNKPAGSVIPQIWHMKSNPSDGPCNTATCYDDYMCAMQLDALGGTASYESSSSFAVLDVPPGALPQPIVLLPSQLPMPPALSGPLVAISGTYEFLHPLVAAPLGAPATLTLSIPGAAMLPGIEVFRLDAGGAWIPEPGNQVVDPILETVAVDVSAIGTYVAVVPGSLAFEIEPPTPTQTDSVAMNLSCGGGLDQAFEHWWYYRTPGDLRELPFRDDGSMTIFQGAGHAEFIWLDVDGLGFGATMILDTEQVGSDAGLLKSSLIIHNDSNAPLTIDVFNYSDVDVASVFATNTVSGSGANHLVREGNDFVDFIGYGHTHSDLGVFGASELGLADGAVLPGGVLAGTLPPFGPGDYTGAYQWAGNVLLPGESRVFDTVLSVCMVEHYGVAVPGMLGDPTIETSTALVQNPSATYSTELLIENSPPNGLGLVLINFAPTNVVLAGVQLWVEPAGAATLLVVMDPLGSAMLPLSIPPSPDLSGLALYEQVLVLDPVVPSGVAGSDGLRTEIISK